MAKIKTKEIIVAADSLSLGISMVVAVLLGVGIGYGLASFFATPWLLWVGVAIGIAAAILNIFKAYQDQVKSYDELKDDPRYQDHSHLKDSDDDED